MTAGRLAGSRPYWAATLVYVVALFSVQPFLGFALDAFKDRWGDRVLDVTAGAVVLAGAVVVGLVVARVWRRACRGQRLAMSLAGVLYGVGVTVARFPQERLHYLEYGVLAALLYIGLASEARAGVPRSRGRAAVWAAVIGSSIGLLDELLQIPWERRYFDWADVVLNVVAVGLGILVAVPAWTAWTADQPERRASP